MTEPNAGADKGRPRPYASDSVPPTYESRKRGGRGWLYFGIAISLLLILAIGTCAWGISGMLSINAERADASRQFIQQVGEDGLPPVDDQIYHAEFSSSQEDIDSLNAFMQPYGGPVSMDDPSCSVFFSAGTTESENGGRSECVTQVAYSESGARVDIIWKAEDEVWKLYYFFINYEKKLESASD